MSTYLSKLINKFNQLYDLNNEVVKFVAVGIFNNLSAIALYQILLFMMNYKLSAFCVYFFGFILTFYSYSRLVFKNNNINYKHGLKYIILYLFNCFVAYYGLIFFVSLLNFNPRICIFIITAFTSSLSFLVSKKIFKNPII